jgi:hypothetical protein
MSGAMPCRHTRAYAVAQAQPSFCYTGHVVPSSLSYWVNPRHGGAGEERRVPRWRARMARRGGAVEEGEERRSSGAMQGCGVRVRSPGQLGE